jgi:hypothetical protein
MATVKPTDAISTPRGKVGGLIYSHQRNGTMTVRGVGTQRAPSTPGEKKGQDRFKLGHGYVCWALSDPGLRAAYTEEACKGGLRPSTWPWAIF